jgi:hypothetical protein
MANLPIYLVDYSLFHCPDERMRCHYQETQASRMLSQQQQHVMLATNNGHTDTTVYVAAGCCMALEGELGNAAEDMCRGRADVVPAPGTDNTAHKSR